MVPKGRFYCVNAYPDRVKKRADLVQIPIARKRQPGSAALLDRLCIAQRPKWLQLTAPPHAKLGPHATSAQGFLGPEKFYGLNAMGSRRRKAGAIALLVTGY